MGGFGQILKDFFTQPTAGSPNWSAMKAADIAQQRQDLEKQNAFYRQQKADEDFHHLATDYGAKYVGPGDLVHDTMDMPTLTAHATENEGLSPEHAQILNLLGDVHATGGIPVMRAADPALIRKHKTAEGDTIKYEFPSVASKGWEAIQAAKARIAGQLEQAQAQGRLAGAAAGTPQVPTTPDYNEQMGLPPGMSTIPQPSAVALAQRVTPANIRAEGSAENTGQRVEGAKTVAGIKAKSASDVAGLRNEGTKTVAQIRADNLAARDEAKQQFADTQNQRKLDYQDRWAAARNAMTSNTQGSLNDRMALRQFDSNQALHGKLQDAMFKEGQKQLDAQTLVSENQQKGLMGTSTVQSVPDGQEFTDPWSGKKMTMSPFQRLRIKAALAASQTHVKSLADRAFEIENRYGLAPQPTGVPGGSAGAAAPAAAPGALPATPPAGAPASTATPAAQAAPAPATPAPKAKVATQADVKDYAAKHSMTYEKALAVFKASKYAVQ